MNLHSAKWLTLSNGIPLAKLAVIHLVKNFALFYGGGGHEGSLPCSQQPARDESSPHSSILASHFIHFNIILACTPEFFKVVCFFGFSHLNPVCIFLM